MKAEISSGVIEYELDDEIVLFVEERGELLRLNATASLVWRGLQSGIPAGDITDLIVQTCGAKRDEVERDVAGLMASLRAVGALVWPSPAYERSYRLLDFQFKLKTSTAFLDAETHQLLSRFAAPNDGSSGGVLEIVREDQQWLLL